MRSRCALGLGLGLGLAACSTPAPPSGDPHVASATSAPATGASRLARFLPATAGAFRGEALETGDVFVRRRYARGPTHVEVTIGDAGAATVAYEQWVQMSAGYPALPLDVPEGAAAGFYDCHAADAGERCDAHLHTKAGFHVELMTGASATRADLDALLAALPLRALASAE